MTRPAKARVRQSFERAAPTYDSAADVQRRICDHLLAALPDETYERLLPHLEPVSMPLGEVVYESGIQMHHVCT